jgi:hypothetical protein
MGWKRTEPGRIADDFECETFLLVPACEGGHVSFIGHGDAQKHDPPVPLEIANDLELEAAVDVPVSNVVSMGQIVNESAKMKKIVEVSPYVFSPVLLDLPVHKIPFLTVQHQVCDWWGWRCSHRNTLVLPQHYFAICRNGILDEKRYGFR